MRILLIEDNPADVMLVKEVLEEHNIAAELQVISSGEAALSYWGRFGSDREISRPDLVLLDLNLPHCGGLEVLERIRKTPASADLNVIVVSSSFSPVDMDRARALGIQEYFRKPTHLGEFMQLGRVIKDVHNRAR